MAAQNVPVVLITGANQGIGYYIAELLSQSKTQYHILVGARNPTRGSDAVAGLLASKTNEASTISTIEVDIASHDSIAAAAAKVSEKYGHLNILINNAAFIETWGGASSVDTTSEWRRVFETNVVGTADMTHTFLPLLQKSSDAKVVIVTSSMGSISMMEAAPAHPMVTTASPYSASKAAINMVMVQWAKNLKGIRLWGIDPGLCATEFAGEYSRTKGRHPREGAEIARQCVEGEREDAVGKVVFEQYGETGVRPW